MQLLYACVAGLQLEHAADQLARYTRRHVYAYHCEWNLEIRHEKVATVIRLDVHSVQTQFNAQAFLARSP